MATTTMDRTELTQKVYARAFALTVRHAPSEAAAHVLVEFARRDPHVLGRARDDLVRLAREHRESAHTDRAVALATLAWLTAIAAA